MILGKDIETNEDFVIFANTLLKSHTFMNGVTGSGKTNTILKIIEMMKTAEFKARFHEIQIILISVKDDYVLVPKHYNNFILFSKSQYPQIFDVTLAFEVGQRARETSLSMVIKTSDFNTLKERQEFVGRFMEGFRSIKLEKANPVLFVIDESDVFVENTRTKNHPSRDIIIDATERARSEGISLLLATQYATQVHPWARANCSNRIVGLTVELIYRKTVAEMLGDKSLADGLWNLKTGQFYFRGHAFPSGLHLVQVDRSVIEMPQAGIQYKEPTGKQEYHDLLQSAVINEGLEPLIIQLQRKINELELLLETEYDRGYDDAKSGRKHQKAVID